MLPIAIVGRACILPGAHDPATFARNVLAGADLVRDAAEGRFGIPNARVLGDGPDRSWTLRGGYVEGWQARELPAELAGLDPLVQWLYTCARDARAGLRPARTAGVFGNLSFPSDGMARFGEALALGRSTGDPRDHFMSGLPAGLLARTLGLEAGAFCLDAACASSIFAIKLACDHLEAGRADLVLAGAVQRADNLFLHVGFCRLGAMSKTGRSRPFHKGADGLLPAEGCVVLALKRLPDAERDGDRILGVIRGVGLSNDGRARGLLAPSSEGQVRAMRIALQASGWSPADVQLFECHATGTPTGDGTEVRSLREVYPGGHLGSLKSNLGHLITTAGAAGVLKVLAAFEARQMPVTLHADDAIDTGPFALLTQGRAWEAPQRRAAVSAFGFGGNNGHLLVEEHRPGNPVSAAVSAPARPIAVVGLARWAGGPAEVEIEGLRFPPADLKASLAQQAVALQLGRDAMVDAGVEAPRDRVGVYVGMGCEGTITRWGLRWRLPERLPEGETYQDLVADPLRAEHVVGTMPNIPANRLNVQLDAAGVGFSVSAEELSGVRALQLACEALRREELDVAVVVAVDLATEPRLRAALAALGDTGPGADAGVALVLARQGDAYGWIADPGAAPGVEADRATHAASGLVAVANALGRDANVHVTAMDGQTATVGLRAGTRRASAPRPRGASFSVPTHVPLPPLPRVEAPMPALPPAPPLPRVLDEIEGRLPNTVHVATARSFVETNEHALTTSQVQPAVAAASPAHAAPAAVATPGAAIDGLPGLFRAHQARVAQVHRAFLEQQARMHASFLQGRSQTSATMVGLARGGVPRTVQPSAPAAPVARPAPVAPPTPPPTAPVPALTRPTAPAPAPAPVAAGPAAPEPAPAAPMTPPASTTPRAFPGPKLDRAALESGASKSITTIFGPDFAELDNYARVVRMPMPPLLLADRVLGIEGPPRVLGKGTIWTETDIREDSWYLHDGRMPPGLMIESGQADLLLGSWQGIDFLNKSERIYRLLGCELTYKGGLPAPGETLHYEIHIDGHAKLGDVRMFFFHYDCTVAGGKRLEVRQGQAGFFTDAELADSGGILWDPYTSTPELGPVAAPVIQPEHTRYDRAQLQAFADGDLVRCFGPSFHRGQTHTWTPRIAGGRMLFLDRAEIDFAGGPWGRGHLRAEQDITPDLWFFDGHFFNDPCMPGTLMFEGCFQAMELYLAAMGLTIDRDGWRFTPTTDVTSKLRCRGQVIPSSKLLVYELFIQEITLGPIPRIKAQVLCTVDGLKCFHADPMVLELVPDWPMSRLPRPLPTGKAEYDYPQLLACAWGRPTDAFGPMYQPFDGPRKVPRLPGPPYHFMTRVVETRGDAGSQKAGVGVVVEYDVPPDAWYFAENGAKTMPFAVLLEAALQPCGWLASWVGCTLGTDQDFLFRNLDGTGTQHREVVPTTGMLRTEVRLDRLSRSGGMIIVAFTVKMSDKAGPIYDMSTVFGFFPPEAFAKQAGVGSTAAEREFLTLPADRVQVLATEPFPGMATGRLRMLDRISVHGPDAFRSEKDVVSHDWFFKAHFYQDPVQPGSLGIEAMIQLLQAAMVERGMTRGMRNPTFEPIAMGQPLTWKYRGQVVPENKLCQTELRITKIEGDTAWADAWLWVDGLRIYAATNLAMRVREGAGPTAGVEDVEVTLPVPKDHAPTWTIPSAAMMTMAMTALAAGRAAALDDAMALRWLTFPDGPRKVRASLGERITLSSDEGEFFRARPTAPLSPPELAPLRNPRPGPSGAELYASGVLFHGPAFQALDRVVAVGDNGATARLRGGFAPDVLLDAATHAIPHDDLRRWFPSLPDGHAAYPARLRHLALLGPLPADGVDVEIRAVGVEAGRAVIDVVLSAGTTPVAWFRLEEVLLPKGPIGTAPPEARRAFLRGEATPGVALATIAGDVATLTRATVRGSDWLPGTVAAVYGSADPTVIAKKELVAARVGAHPRDIREDGTTAHAPLERWPFSVDGDRVTIGARTLDLDPVFAWWRTHGAPGPWPGETIVARLAQAWLAQLRVVDPAAMQALRGRPVLYLGNHETYLESPIFCVLMSALYDLPVRALAKVEHQAGWLGALHALLTTYPGRALAGFIAWFDQADPASLPQVLAAEGRSSSLLVHVEGTRQTSPADEVGKISSIWADLAVERGLPVVPVAFRGSAVDPKADVPAGPQVHVVGRPILPEELAALPYAARRARIRDAIDVLPRFPVTPDGRTGTPARKIVDVVGDVGAADEAWLSRWRAFGG